MLELYVFSYYADDIEYAFHHFGEETDSEVGLIKAGEHEALSMNSAYCCAHESNGDDDRRDDARATCFLLQN